MSGVKGVYCVLYSLQSQFSICCSVVIQNRTGSPTYKFVIFSGTFKLLDILKGPTKYFVLMKVPTFQIYVLEKFIQHVK